MAHDAPSTPEILVGVSFGDAFRAQEFLTAATRLGSGGKLKLRDAVFIERTDEGDVRVRETIDPQPGPSAISGAVWASLFGLLLGGPVGWLAGAALGAGTGVATAKLVDLGIPDEWVDWFRAAVQPSTTILALLVTDLDREALTTELGRFHGAHLVYANLEPNALDRIHAALGDDAASVPGTTPDAPG